MCHRHSAAAAARKRRRHVRDCRPRNHLSLLLAVLLIPMIYYVVSTARASREHA
jgi:hypothetical protein